ncbi:MAG: oxidoreductase, partial [Planctomycetota bacterium]
HAGCICPISGLRPALDAARALRERIAAQGIACSSPGRGAEVFRWWHMALLSEAMLQALVDYTEAGGGSRGARAYCDPDGDGLPSARSVDCSPWRFRNEHEQLRSIKQVLRWQGDAFHIEHRPLRNREDPTSIFFEKDWAHFLAGSITDDGFRHRPLSS